MLQQGQIAKAKLSNQVPERLEQDNLEVAFRGRGSKALEHVHEQVDDLLGLLPLTDLLLLHLKPVRWALLPHHWVHDARLDVQVSSVEDLLS